ncbi:MAG: nucleotide exchange factor GrpE, partial [Pseudomonadota bacterium]|nr:nucleotide exchange factor GrpE [Pseudomonadota bacterium]
MTDDIRADAMDDDAAELSREDQIEALKAEIAALKDQALRALADAENTKRRAERDANNARAYAIEKFARDLIGAADNLASAVQHAPKGSEDAQVKNLVLGIEMTEKALQGAFERNGLKRVAPEKGAKFDPNVHQAMMEQEDASVPPGSVVLLAQPGYELLGRL